MGKCVAARFIARLFACSGAIYRASFCKEGHSTKKQRDKSRRYV
ncbi:hypothetical protein L579_4444 [Pantoea sp. AS-PWVM4]|nr:hypothetical protein L579_4444 [Pantoea sp. AS-PWVM4]